MTIRTMMLGVLAFAVGFAALRYPTRLGASALFSLTSVIFVISTIRAVIRKTPGSIGFTIAGGAYVALHFGIWPWLTYMAATRGEIGGPPPVTTVLLDVAYPFIIPAARLNQGMTLSDHPMNSPADFARYALSQWTDIDGHPSKFLGVSSPRTYQDSGHALFALLVGFLGSIVGRSIARQDPPPAKDA